MVAINRATETGESDAVRRGTSVAIESIAHATPAGKRHVRATREPSRSLLTARATAACAGEARPHDYGAKPLGESLQKLRSCCPPSVLPAPSFVLPVVWGGAGGGCGEERSGRGRGTHSGRHFCSSMTWFE